MKLSELMKDYTPSESYEGWVTNDDYVFAIDTAPNGSTATKEGDYVVVEMGIAGLMQGSDLSLFLQYQPYKNAGELAASLIYDNGHLYYGLGVK